MEIGDRVTEVLHFGEGYGETHTGTVVYIHPERRYYTAEFIFPGGRFRESFFPPEHGRIWADEP